MNNCAFCKELSNIVYDDQDLQAVLDIDPISKGHTIIMPKKHHVDLLSMPEKLLHKTIVLAKKIGRILKEKYGFDSISIYQTSGEAQDVKHFHLHVFGRQTENDLKIIWPETSHETKEEQREIAKILRDGLTKQDTENRQQRIRQ